MALTQVNPGLLDSNAQYTGFKNRIINGAMVIDQRNAGAAVTPTNGQYTVDRWLGALTQASKFSVQQNAGAITSATGFSNYLGVTSLSAYSIAVGDVFSVRQYIEGFNTSDLSWGTANAKTVTLSFQVYSSLTGTFGGAVQNSAFSRSYPFSYTVSSANTWTSISVTIAGDTTGTWIGATNGIGLRVEFGLGVGSTYSTTAGAWAAGEYHSATGATSVVGTNGATFYITGVQLEKGSTATSFDYRPYGTELQLCQRYYQGAIGSGAFGACRVVNASTAIFVPWASTMRAAPTFTLTGSSVVFAVPGSSNYTYTSATISTTGAETTTSSYVYIGGSSTVAVGTLSFLTQGYINASSEL